MERKPKPTTWLLKNVNWQLFKKELDNKIVINNNIDSAQKLENEVLKFTEALQFARNQVAKKLEIKQKEDSLTIHIQ